MPSSRGSSQPGDQIHVPCVSCMAGRFFTTEPHGKPLNKGNQPSLILDVPFKAVLADKGVPGAREFTARIGAWTKPISLWTMTQGAQKPETQLSLCPLTKHPQFPPPTFLQDGVVRSSTTQHLFCAPLHMEAV